MTIFDWTEDTPIESAIGEVVGFASRCWDSKDVFESQQALQAVDELTDFFASRINQAYSKDQDVEYSVDENPMDPRLGCATTEHLFREIICRLIVEPDNMRFRINAEKMLPKLEMS